MSSDTIFSIILVAKVMPDPLFLDQERETHNPLVEGSSPSGPTISIKFL